MSPTKKETEQQLISALLVHPIAKQIRDETDAAKLAGRHRLVSELEAYDSPAAEREIVDANKRLAQAQAKFDRAKAAFEEARDALYEAHQRSLGLGTVSQHCRAKVVRQLLESADLRIGEFIIALEAIGEVARNNVVSVQNPGWQPKTLPWHGEMPKYLSNIEEISALRERLSAAMADAKSWMLQAFTRDELTTRMTKWCTDLLPMVIAADLRAVMPVITSDSVEWSSVHTYAQRLAENRRLA